MALRVYHKQIYSPKRQMASLVSYTSLTIGALLLFWSFYPVISFEIYSRLFIQRHYESPIPRTTVASSLEAANSVLGSYTVFSNNLRDFTQAAAWFPSQPQTAMGEVVQQNRNIKNYTLTIPKLNIQGANVNVGGDDLARSLVQYLPRSLPGEYGNVVVFGHSSLPQLYDAKNYKTIFTYLPSLQKGDKINLTMEGSDYEYEVYDMFIVNPDEISVLEENKSAPYLTLITCVPPGTWLKRLVVRAKLTQLLQ